MTSEPPPVGGLGINREGIVAVGFLDARESIVRRTRHFTQS